MPNRPDVEPNSQKGRKKNCVGARVQFGDERQMTIFRIHTSTPITESTSGGLRCQYNDHRFHFHSTVRPPSIRFRGSAATSTYT